MILVLGVASHIFLMIPMPYKVHVLLLETSDRSTHKARSILTWISRMTPYCTTVELELYTVRTALVVRIMLPTTDPGQRHD